MKKKWIHKQALLFCFSIIVINIQAQSLFRYRAVLDTVTTAAFYKIPLTPLTVAKCGPQLFDLRIVDANAQQIPYLLKKESAIFSEKKFVAFPLLSVQKEADKQTHITLKANDTETIDRLLLIIKNTDAIRMVTLSGSNNGRNWFVIKENIYLDNYFTEVGDRFVQQLSFPPSNYPFYQITILGEDVLPINIVQAGIYREAVQTTQALPLVAKNIVQKDSSDKNSYITITWNEAYTLDKLTLQAEGARYYKRSLYIPSTGDNFYISSNGNSSFPLNITKQVLHLVIRNADNPPLKIIRATAWQQQLYLLTYLEPGKNYELQMGDSTLQAPQYDLAFFKDSIPANPHIVKTSDAERMPDIIRPASKNFFNKTTMWVLIVFAAIILLLFSWQLIKQIQ